MLKMKWRIWENPERSLYQRVTDRLREANQDVSVVKEEWFSSQPCLIICGAGHVSCELARMAACLDFYIKVIDDRQEFVTKERFPEADERICDTFAHLGEYLEPDAYYVAVTRGHQDDFTCVKTILSHPHRYVGMIGSREKAEKTLDKLRTAGFGEEEIKKVFTPIGLDIQAVTPAEIAVSILAQIILEKNRKYSSFVSRELLNYQGKGTLCIIIEKSGSAPRGPGSMMLVTDNGVIDSIGGGAIEFAALQDARKSSEIRIKEYSLDVETGRELGMICGGRNKVLFIPL